MLTDFQLEELRRGAYGSTREHIVLKDYTTFHIGGAARMLIEPTSEKELLRSVRYLRAEGIPFYILGNGSNVLFRDGGFDGIIIRLGKLYSDICIDGSCVTAQAGALLSAVAKASFRASLTGMEALSGIPGTIGGAVVMNAGAYNSEMKDVIASVRAIDAEGEIIELSCEALALGYRTSRVQSEGLIVTEVTLQLKSGDAADIEAAYADYTQRRVSKQPLDKYSAGSTFKRPVNGYASKLIDDAGLRGYAFREAQVSDKHCGFLINNGNATCSDMLTLIGQVQERVRAQFGIELEPEVRIVGEK